MNKISTKTLRYDTMEKLLMEAVGGMFDVNDIQSLQSYEEAGILTQQGFILKLKDGKWFHIGIIQSLQSFDPE